MTTLLLPTQTSDDAVLFNYSGASLLPEETRRIELELRRRLYATESKTFILDLREVESVTASGLGALVALHRRLRNMSGHLTLRNVKPQPLEVIRLCRLDEVLDILA